MNFATFVGMNQLVIALGPYNSPIDLPCLEGIIRKKQEPLMLKRCTFLTFGALCLGLVLVTAVARCEIHAKEDGSSTTPNVIILFSDQHNKKVMGFEGHPDVITPNLDQLANEGLVFNRAYCTVGICVPSRSSLMTGLYPRTLGLLSNGGATSVVKNAVSMATILRLNQYQTYAFGKRHLRGAIDEGWDVHKSHMHHESPDENYITWLEKKGVAKAFAEDWAAEFGRGPKGSSAWEARFPTADLGTRVSKLPEDCTMEAYTTRETIDVIKKHGHSGQPFFCWANFYRPHQPYTPLKKYMDMYDVSAWGKGTKQGSAIKKPESFYEPTENLPPMLQSQRNGGNRLVLKGLDYVV